MQKKTWIIGLVALATIGSAYLPLRASADDAGIQENEQSTVITGKGNYSGQRNSQVRVNNANRVNTSSGTVQRNRQISDLDGIYNESSQVSEQTSVDNGSSRTPRSSRTETCSSGYYSASCK